MQSNKLYPGLKEVLLQCQYPWCAASVEHLTESVAQGPSLMQGKELSSRPLCTVVHMLHSALHYVCLPNQVKRSMGRSHRVVSCMACAHMQTGRVTGVA